MGCDRDYPWYKCRYCDVGLWDKTESESHLNSKEHKKVMKKIDANGWPAITRYP